MLHSMITMYRIQSFIELLLGCFNPLSYYNQPIKLKMEESDDIEHTSINNFADSWQGHFVTLRSDFRGRNMGFLT